MFVLAAFTRRANGPGTIIGLLITAVVLYFVKNHTPLHFFLYNMVGIASTVVLGYIASLIIPAQPKNLEGLTIYSLFKRASNG